MSTRTARAAAAKSSDKPAAKRAATATAAAVKKSQVVNLEHKAEKKNSHQFSNSKSNLITGVYVSKAVVALLDQQKTVDLTFAPFDGNQPKNSIRFTEQGKAQAIGSLYLMRPGCAKLSIVESSTVKLRLSENDGKLSATVSKA